jgi:hypothetical protein
MAADEKKMQSSRITLRITDLAIQEGKRAELEKSAEEMADLADSFGYLDPLAEEPSVIFDPMV